jgi:RNA polymerase sigma factor (sigma-70 family)
VDPGWEEIYAARYRRLVALVAVLAGSLGEAEEAVQDAFVQALGRPIDGIDDPEAWLYRVATNQVRSRWRRLLVARRHAATLADEPVDGSHERFDERATLIAALRQLPLVQREALALHYMADLPIGDIAQRLGVPVGTVKARLSRGRDALRRVLSGTGDTISRLDLEGSLHA